MYESWGTIHIHTLKSLTSLIEINHSKEHFAGIKLTVSVTACHKAELLACLPTIGTTTVTLKSSEHYNNRVVLGLGPHQVLEVLIRELYDWPSLCEIK